MLNVGAITAVVKADISGFKSAMQEVKGQTSQLPEHAKRANGFGTFFKANLTAAGVAAGALTASIGLLGKAALGLSSDAQNMRTNLDILTGSTEKGAEMFKYFYNFAAKTPFETADLVKAGSTMMSFGISSEKTKASLSMLGDVALGNKDKLAGLSLVYGQIQSTGRLMGQDLLQLINQGFNPLTIISQKTGKSMAELKQDMEDGAISADMVTDAFVTATSKGGLFYQGMEKGSKTVSGLLSTLTDNIKMAVLSFIGIDSEGSIRENSIFAFAAKAIGALVQATSNLQPYITAATDWIQKNQWAMAGLAGAIIGLVVLALVALISAMSGALVLMGIFALAGMAIGALAFIIYKNWEPISNFFINIWNTIATAFTTAVNWIKDQFNYLKNHFWEILGQILGFMITLPYKMPLLIGEGIWAIIKLLASIDWVKVFSVIWEGFKAVGNWIKNIGIEIWEFLKNIKWGELFINIGKGIANAIIGLIEGAIKGAAKGIPGLGGLADKINIPRFASGVSNFRGGLAIVNEEGPELINLPSGANVIPAKATAEMLGGTRNEYNITIEAGNVIGSDTELRQFARKLQTAFSEIVEMKGGAANGLSTN